MREPRGARLDWYWLMLVAAILLALLVAFWPNPATPGVSRRPPQVPPSSGTGTTPPAPSSSPARGAVSQPDLSGYEYRVSTERYLVRQQDGQLEVQDRRRESWRAGDGWVWARQIGSDPGRFIFAPTNERRAIRAARPTTAAQQRVLHTMVGTAKTSTEVTQAEYGFVEQLLSTENLPDSALPQAYRSALLGALATNDGVTTTKHVNDPAGRDATRISWTSGPLTMSLYLDRDDNYLASTQVVEHTGE